MTTKAEEARAKEMLDKTSRLGMLVESAMDSVADLRRFVKCMEDEGCNYNEIGKVLGIPGYCIKVMMGETRGNRPLPEYAHHRRR